MGEAFPRWQWRLMSAVICTARRFLQMVKDAQQARASRAAEFFPCAMDTVAGIIMINRFPQLLLAGILLFAVATLLSLITLPVEFDASRRGLAWLNRSNVTNQQELSKN